MLPSKSAASRVNLPRRHWATVAALPDLILLIAGSFALL